MPTSQNPPLPETTHTSKKPESEHTREHLESELNFIDGVSVLLESLQKYDTPVRILHELEFLPQENGTYYYPETLRYRLIGRTFEKVLVTIVQEGDEPSTTTIEFFDEDGSIHISRDSVVDIRPSDISVPVPFVVDRPDPVEHFDAIIDNQGNETTIAKIPNYEIDAFLFSLIGNYPEANLVSLEKTTKSVAGENILASLVANSVIAKTYFEHDLGDDLSVRYVMSNGIGRSLDVMTQKLVSFQIDYRNANRDKMKASMNLGKGLSVDFRILNNSESNDYFPEDTDYTEVIDVIRIETSRILNETETTNLPPNEMFRRPELA